MPRLLPPVLSTADLPESELCAARLDGELFGVGEGYGVVDEIERPDHRAASLAAWLPPRLIAERRTAAWVLGATQRVPWVVQLCAESDARCRATGRGPVEVREVVIDARDILLLGGLRVTTPLRTAVDLVRTLEVFDEEDATVVRELAVIGGFGVQEGVAMLDRRRNLPGKRLARARLEAALGRGPAR